MYGRSLTTRFFSRCHAGQDCALCSLRSQTSRTEVRVKDTAAEERCPSPLTSATSPPGHLRAAAAAAAAALAEVAAEEEVLAEEAAAAASQQAGSGGGSGGSGGGGRLWGVLSRLGGAGR